MKSSVAKQLSSRVLWGYFCLGCVLFIFTRLYLLEDFPIFFFCDEAFIGVTARQLLDHGFRDVMGRFLPMYYEKAPGRWVPQLSIYLSLLTTYFWPTSIFALRAVTVAISFISAIFPCLALKRAFRDELTWWVPIFILVTMPVWFIHSRIAFETSLVVACYTIYLSCYLIYRTSDSRYVWGCAVTGMMMFYLHLSGTIVFGATSLLLGLSDLKFHFRQRRTLLPVIGFVFLALCPFVFWVSKMPSAPFQQLVTLNPSIGNSNIFRPLFEEGFSRYISALDPRYWFLEDHLDQIRHIWRGRTLMSQWTLIPLSVGLLVALVRFKQGEFRALLLSLLASTTPVLLVESHIMRVFYIIAPVCLLASVGIMTVAKGFSKWVPVKLPIFISVVLCLVQVFTMTQEMKDKAPTWFDEYGLYGLQWGAKQLYVEAIPRYLREHPEAQLTYPADWANGEEIFDSFFLSQEQRQHFVVFESDHEATTAPPIPANLVFILSRAQLKELESSKRFKKPVIEQTIYYPNGEPGFVFARLAYVDNIEDVIRQLRAWSLELLVDRVPVGSNQATVSYSRLDGGQISNLVDNNPATIIRSMTANPMILNIHFDRPERIRTLKGIFWPMKLLWKVRALTSTGEVIFESVRREILNEGDAGADLTLSTTPVEVSTLEMEISNLLDPPDSSHVHFREMSWNSD